MNIWMTFIFPLPSFCSFFTWARMYAIRRGYRIVSPRTLSLFVVWLASAEILCWNTRCKYCRRRLKRGCTRRRESCCLDCKSGRFLSENGSWTTQDAACGSEGGQGATKDKALYGETVPLWMCVCNGGWLFLCVPTDLEECPANGAGSCRYPCGYLWETGSNERACIRAGVKDIKRKSLYFSSLCCPYLYHNGC